MQTIADLDTRLFCFINGKLSTGLLDVLMPYVTQKSNFIGVIIVAVALIMILGRQKDRWGLLILVAVVATSDLMANALKHLLMRTRPCNAMDGVRLLVGCSSSYSMPSGHATNIFAGMVFLTLRYKKLFPFFLGLAVLVAYSRVYVGVHYPLDVAAGAVLGTALAFIYSECERRVVKKKLLQVLKDYKRRRGGY